MATAVGHEDLSARDDDDERATAAAAAATQRAESAALRAEASAQRAERSAENTRVNRAAAEIAAVEADAAAAAAKKSASLQQVMAAPRHGSFGDERFLRPPQPTVAGLRQCPSVSDDGAGGGVTIASVPETSNITDSTSRRAVRLAERASMTARLELLSAATEAERGAESASCSSSFSGTISSDHRGQIRTPWDETIETVEKPAGGRLRGDRDGVHHPNGRNGLEEDYGGGADDWPGRVAAVASSSGSGVDRVQKSGVSRLRTSGRTQDVEYWNRPAKMAAAVAATASKSSIRAPRRRRRATATAAAEPKHSVVALNEARGSTLGDTRGRAPELPISSALPPPPPLGVVGRERVAVVGAGAVEATVTAAADADADAAAVSQEARRRRRVLEHVEVGRGGQEYYRDVIQRRIQPTEDGSTGSLVFGDDDSPPHPEDIARGEGYGHDDGGAQAVDGDDGGEECFYPQQRWPASTLNPKGRVFHQQRGGYKMVVGHGARVAGTGVAAGSPRRKKKVTKKRKSRPAPAPAAAAAVHSVPLDRRQAGRVHPNGTICARSCAVPTCPCGRAVAAPITTAAWTIRRSVGAWR